MKLTNGDTAKHKHCINSTSFPSDTGGDSSLTAQSSETGRAVPTECSTRDNEFNAKESSIAGSDHKGSNSANDCISQSCHNGDTFSEVADSNHNGSNSATSVLSCHNGDTPLEVSVSSGDTAGHTFIHNTCIFKKRFGNKKCRYSQLLWSTA